MNFYNGYDYAYYEGNVLAVRLVRGGQYALLSVTKAGSGTVTSTLPGVDCGPYCQGSFANEMLEGKQVILTATPDANFTFGSWTGCLSVNGDKCTVNSPGDQAVTATFKANQTIGAITFNPTTLAVGGSTAASATATSGLPVTFTSTTTGVCTVSGTNGSTVSGVTAGTCTIAANQAGDDNYNPATQVTQDLTVGKGSQATLTVTGLPASAVFGQTGITAGTTGGSGTGAITYSAGASTACTVNTTSGAVTIISGTGTCAITATRAADTNYLVVSSAPVSITIGKADQTISFTSTAPSGATVGGTAYTATATSTSGLTVSLSIDASASAVCTLSGSTVSFTGAGTCTINANRAGNDNYNTALQQQQIFSVGQASTTTSLTGHTPDPSVVGQAVTVNFTVAMAAPVPTSATVQAVNGVGPTGTVTVTANSGESCSPVTLSGGAGSCNLTFTSAGAKTLTATYAGDTNFTGSSDTKSHDVLATTAQGNAGGGAVTAAITGGTCVGFANGSTSFPAAPTPLPPGVTFPYGVFDFTALGCGDSNGTITITLTYPNPLPVGVQYWKYISGTWVDWTSQVTIAGNTVVLTLTDGGTGDTNPNPGEISDPSGPAFGSGPTPIPTLSEWAMLLLGLLLSGLVWRQLAAPASHRRR